MNTSDESRSERFTAYRLPGYASYPEIARAAADREWMDAGTNGWANRCLPLRMANQAGWFILNDADVEIVWSGKRTNDSLKVLYPSGAESQLVSSMFGFGIVTWTIPYLFRTPPGFNLFVHGPANLPRDGMTPLDGLVETDWLPYPFTMNWQVTKRLKSIRVKRGEPICMLAPVRRKDIEDLRPEVRNLESEPELLRSFNVWHESRKEKVKEQAPGVKSQGHYIRGEGHLGERPEHGHQTKMHLSQFEILVFNCIITLMY